MTLLREPLLCGPFLAGAASISTLLLYFYGIAPMRATAVSVLLPATALLATILWWARWTQRWDLWNRIWAGLFAGSLATLTYDLVRVPIVWSGVPVFKAISYFGTVMLGEPAPTLASELTGWTYHFSNGVGFGLMYAVMIDRPRWWSAVLWGVTLEAAMLLTPYAEVFGYKVSSQFLGITIGAHVVYGLTLWGALLIWCRDEPLGAAPAVRFSTLMALWLLAPLGVAVAAADFSTRYRTTIPPSPPTYVGPHLYVTWDVPEPDRLASLWLLRRFRDPKAQFHFIAPFTQTAYGIPFDIPEADIRREGARATTEVLADRIGRAGDAKIAVVARMGHLTEITPWMLPSDPQAAALADDLRTVVTKQCQERLTERCAESAFVLLENWFTGS